MNTEVEEEAKFKQSLAEFLTANGVVRSEPDFEHSPFRIYQLVCRRGGFQVLTLVGRR